MYDVKQLYQKATNRRPHRLLPPSITVCMAAVILFAAGCGDDDPTSPVPGGNGNQDPIPNGVGLFSVAVSGAHTASGSGSAISVTTESQPGWGMIMNTTTGDRVSAFAVSTPAGGLPEPGTYPMINAITQTNPEAGEFEAALLVGGTSYVPTGGSITIISSSSSTVDGTFDFSAIAVLDQSQTITVRGSFNSRHVHEQDVVQ